MSALPPKADIRFCLSNVRFVPKADMDALGEAASAFAEAVIRSVEFIVQPAAQDAVGEMGVRGDFSSGHRMGNNRTCEDTRSDACGIERAKVHPKALYFPSPTGSCQLTLRAVADHPTGIDLRMTERLGNREFRIGAQKPADCVRSVYLDLAVGQPPADVGHHLPIPPHITDASTHR